jgi:hypothetical protein
MYSRKFGQEKIFTNLCHLLSLVKFLSECPVFSDIEGVTTFTTLAKIYSIVQHACVEQKYPD